MEEPETTSLITIDDLAGNLPNPVKVGLLKALGGLVGGIVAIPTAWLRGPAKEIDDITAGRSAVAAALARRVAEESLADPVLMQAAAEVYLPTNIRKARNRVQVAHLAIGHTASSQKDFSIAVSPDDDWMNVFSRFAEDASSEKLQDMFGRILAGEVVNPGSFSLATLRTVSELDQSIAHDFSVVWAKSVGTAVDYNVEFWKGEWFSRWSRLAEAGLMAPTSIVQYLPEKLEKKGDSPWVPMGADGTHLIVDFPQSCTAKWAHISFTRVGCQIGSILARPDYEENMRKAGQNLALQGVSRVRLFTVGKPMELIYSAHAN